MSTNKRDLLVGNHGGFILCGRWPGCNLHNPPPPLCSYHLWHKLMGVGELLLAEGQLASGPDLVFLLVCTVLDARTLRKSRVNGWIN